MAMSPREWWTQKRQELSASKCEPFMIPSAHELTPAQQAVVDGIVVKAAEDRLARARKCTEGVCAVSVLLTAYHGLSPCWSVGRLVGA